MQANASAIIVSGSIQNIQLQWIFNCSESLAITKQASNVDDKQALKRTIKHKPKYT